METVSSASDAGNLVQAALDYVQHGIAVIQDHYVRRDGLCSCGRDTCTSAGKHPRGTRWQTRATTDPNAITELWRKSPKSNVGIHTEASGLLIIDVDPRNGGDDTLRELEAQHGPLPFCPEVRTPSGGRHLYLREPQGEHITRRTHALGPGVDVPLHVVAPPSVAGLGAYSWVEGRGLDDVEIPEAPRWVVEILTSSTASGTERKGRERLRGVLEGVPEGQRDEKLFREACRLVALGLDRAEVEVIILEAARRCIPPFPEVQALAKVESAFRYPSDAEARCALTDVGNAQRFAIRHGADLRYDHVAKRWLVWTGQYWGTDEIGSVMIRAKEVARSILRQAAEEADDAQRTELVKHARRSESASRLKAMEELARSELPVLAESLDRDPWLLNVINGTIDLRTGELRPHDRDDLITKIAPVRYDPTATSPLLMSFLERVIPDPELRAFVQRAAGYSISGDVGEEVLFFTYGPGSTGKSTLLRAIAAALGDYARSADFDTFAKRSTAGGARNDIARLAGSRFVTSLEVDEGTKLAEAVVKQLTGGDRVAARFLYRESFEFVPQFKLWLAANNKPRVEGTDGAIWRRILLMPFEVVIPPDERDPDVKRRLADPTESGSAILSWLVEGCLAWQRDGLGVPDVVREATEDYRAEEDHIAQFLFERIERADGFDLNTGLLRAQYIEWCQKNRVTPLNQVKLSQAFEAHGLVPGRTGNRRFWRGIRFVNLNTTGARSARDEMGGLPPELIDELLREQIEEAVRRVAAGESPPRFKTIRVHNHVVYQDALN